MNKLGNKGLEDLMSDTVIISRNNELDAKELETYGKNLARLVYEDCPHEFLTGLLDGLREYGYTIPIKE